MPYPKRDAKAGGDRMEEENGLSDSDHPSAGGRRQVGCWGIPLFIRASSFPYNNRWLPSLPVSRPEDECRSVMAGQPDIHPSLHSSINPSIHQSLVPLLALERAG